MMPLTMARRVRLSPSGGSPGGTRCASTWPSSAFVVDSPVTVVNEIAGSLILQVKDGRIAWKARWRAASCTDGPFLLVKRPGLPP